jgi:hypothetical protein
VSRRRGRTGRRQIVDLPTQPASIYWAETGDAANAGASAYAHPGGLVVAGRTNYADQVFKDVSAGGGTVLVYIDPMVINNWGPYHSLLFDSSVYGGAVPQWGTYQANATGVLTDIRTVADGGAGLLQSKLPSVLAKVVSDNPHIGGFFMDDVGSMSWYPNLDWNTVPTADQNAYRNGAIAICQTARNVCNAHGLIFLVNGTWTGGTVAGSGGGWPTLGTNGMALADGGMVEHHDGDSIPFWTSYADPASTQWGAQSPVTNGRSLNLAVMNTSAGLTSFNGTGVFAYSSQQTTAQYTGVAPWGSFHATGLPSSVRY